MNEIISKIIKACSEIWPIYNRIIIELTSFDEVRRAEASMELLCTRALIFLKEATTDIGTALSENVNQIPIYIWLSKYQRW